MRKRQLSEGPREWGQRQELLSLMRPSPWEWPRGRAALSSLTAEDLTCIISLNLLKSPYQGGRGGRDKLGDWD